MLLTLSVDTSAHPPRFTKRFLPDNFAPPPLGEFPAANWRRYMAEETLEATELGEGCATAGHRFSRLGTPHPYLYRVTGLGAREVYLLGTIHVSMRALYGDDVPSVIIEALEAADGIFTEIDFGCSVEEDTEDTMGQVDCSEALIGTTPAARHFSGSERARIARLLATNPEWRDDMLMPPAGCCNGTWHSSTTFNMTCGLSVSVEDEAMMRDTWNRYPAADDSMPWRSVGTWRVLEQIWWGLMLHNESQVGLLWRVLKEMSDQDQRRALLGLTGADNDLIFDEFISRAGTAEMRSGVEDETRCLFYEEREQSVGSEASARLDQQMQCFEAGVGCLEAVGIDDPQKFISEIVSQYLCPAWTTGRNLRHTSRTNLAFRRNSQMTSAIVRLANDSSNSDKRLVFAFGVAHFEGELPSVITMLCEQGFGVEHVNQIGASEDRCAIEHEIQNNGVVFKQMPQVGLPGVTVLVPLDSCVPWGSQGSVRLSCAYADMVNMEYYADSQVCGRDGSRTWPQRRLIGSGVDGPFEVSFRLQTCAGYDSYDGAPIFGTCRRDELTAEQCGFRDYDLHPGESNICVWFRVAPGVAVSTCCALSCWHVLLLLVGIVLCCIGLAYYCLQRGVSRKAGILSGVGQLIVWVVCYVISSLGLWTTGMIPLFHTGGIWPLLMLPAGIVSICATRSNVMGQPVMAQPAIAVAQAQPMSTQAQQEQPAIAVVQAQPIGTQAQGPANFQLASATSSQDTAKTRCKWLLLSAMVNFVLLLMIIFMTDLTHILDDPVIMLGGSAFTLKGWLVQLLVVWTSTAFALTISCARFWEHGEGEGEALEEVEGEPLEEVDVVAVVNPLEANSSEDNDDEVVVVQAIGRPLGGEESRGVGEDCARVRT